MYYLVNYINASHMRVPIAHELRNLQISHNIYKMFISYVLYPYITPLFII